MRNVAPWQTTVILLSSLTVALVVLEAVARALAPPKQDDPRLGIFGFWLWVSVVAATTYLASLFLELSEHLAGRILTALWALGWLASEFGFAHWEGTPREK
jgi:hypothetical protein